MSVQVRIPRVLRGHTAGKSNLDVEAENLTDLLDRLYEQFPTLKNSLSSDGVDVLDHTNIFVNDVEVREIGGLSAELKSGDTVTILPSMAGGGYPRGQGARSFAPLRATRLTASR